MGRFKAQLFPGEALGFLVLGAPLQGIITRLESERRIFTQINLAFDEKAPVTEPVLVTLPDNGLRLRFDGPEQRLRLIEVLDFSKNTITWKDKDLVKPSTATANPAAQVSPSPFPASVPTGPTFRQIYHKLFGPTYEGDFVNPENGEHMGDYALSYPGVSFSFPMSPSVYHPTKDVVSLLSHPESEVAKAMAVFRGESWPEARETLYTEVLPSINEFKPLRGKQKVPDEVALVRIYGNGKLQIMRKWLPTSTSATSATAAESDPNDGPDDDSDLDDNDGSTWVILGETTAQDLCISFGPPDDIYPKSSQRLPIHHTRSASKSSSGLKKPAKGRDPRWAAARCKTAAIAATPATPETESAFAHVDAQDYNSYESEEADEDEFDDLADNGSVRGDDNKVDGKFTGACFYNYFHHGFDVLMDYHAAVSPMPPSQAKQKVKPPPRLVFGNRGLVATKVILHGNVPGSHSFNRYRRCRWEIAYLPGSTLALSPGSRSMSAEGGMPTVNSETKFPIVQQRLRHEWDSIYTTKEDADHQQRGITLPHGWNDSLESSCELLQEWEPESCGSEGSISRKSAVRGPQTERSLKTAASNQPRLELADGAATGIGTANLRDSSMLYGFPGLVFEVLPSGDVNTLTVF